MHISEGPCRHYRGQARTEEKSNSYVIVRVHAAWRVCQGVKPYLSCSS